MNPVVEWVAVTAFELVLWIVLFPIVLLLATPVVLVTALFQRGNYSASVLQMFGAITQFWVKCAGAVL